jgi:hypothetical protein
MLVGVNYPWIDYAWDFGDPPAAWVSPESVAAWRAKKREQIAADFRAFAEMGMFAIRWFMLADGLSYGVGEEAPKITGDQWAFDPLPAEHPFYKQLRDDFEFVLKTCTDLKIKILPSLIDFHWLHPGTVAQVNANIIKGGRADVVRDPAKSRAFFDATLEPLLELSLRYPDAIYAWELVNEPEWVTETRSLIKIRSDENKTVTLDQMRAFIAEGIGRINAKQLPDGRQAFRSTVGFAHWDAIESWDSAGLGVTLHQFHYYAPDKREIPKHTFSEEYPCIVGEFATAFQRGWPELKKGDLARTISIRLQCLEDKGYPAVFLWSAKATDEASTWTNTDQQETISFIKTSTNGGNDVVA